MSKAKIYVYLKKGILDPQGKAVHRILGTMNYNQVKNVRIGKFINIEFENGLSKDQIKSQTEEFCKKLLANPIIEDFHFEIEENEARS